MSCTSPLKAFYSLGSDGRKQIHFYHPESNNFISYDKLPDDNKILIPCGQCTSCRLSYAQNWATRCVLEAKQWNYNYFVTLTFNDNHLPYSEYNRLDYDTGEFLGYGFSSSLASSHLQTFMKNLRRYFKYHFDHDNIRFFACGEYGPKNMRPHYHVILFNCPIPDLHYECSNFQGDSYYSSKILEQCWSNQGFVTVADCNFATCSYVARYMLKKQKGETAKRAYYDLGLKEPFTLCSTRPGIARTYFDENSSTIYNYDKIIITGADGIAKKVRPPSYFDKLYDIFDHDDMARIKDKRKQAAESSMSSVLSRTSKSLDEYLSVKDFYANENANKLLRNL